ncbi:MAG: hypothetical protein QFC78_09305, partial [Pseudomonadota bacterium]|nr:hypothetical protein [Pseudomonadota bacterium]
MELDTLLQHFFGTDDPSQLSEDEYDRAIGQLKIGFGVEREPGRRFALWCLMEALGIAPLPADAFAKEPKLKAAADEYLSAAFRMER